MKKDEFDKYLVGSRKHLTGYTSTSTDPNVAAHFANYDQNHDKIPVIFIIKFKSQRGLFAMTDGFSAYN